MTKHAPTTVNRSIRLAPAYWGRIEELAEAMGLSQSNVVTIAIDRMYERSAEERATGMVGGVTLEVAAPLWEAWANDMTYEDVALVGAMSLEQRVKERVETFGQVLPDGMTARDVAIALRAYAMAQARGDE